MVSASLPSRAVSTTQPQPAEEAVGRAAHALVVVGDQDAHALEPRRRLRARHRQRLAAGVRSSPTFWMLCLIERAAARILLQLLRHLRLVADPAVQDDRRRLRISSTGRATSRLIASIDCAAVRRASPSSSSSSVCSAAATSRQKISANCRSSWPKRVELRALDVERADDLVARRSGHGERAVRAPSAPSM